jgi:beta-lactamase class A
VKYATSWTDDMFMATSVLARAAKRTGDARYADAVARLLTTYATRLQRDGRIFVHAESGPHAWGRGNGFAAFGLMEALTHLPETWTARPQVLDSFRRLMDGMRRYQAPDGAWQQVVDEPGTYREFTVTAMTVAAMARGLRLGWLDRSFDEAMNAAGAPCRCASPKRATSWTSAPAPAPAGMPRASTISIGRPSPGPTTAAGRWRSPPPSRCTRCACPGRRLRSCVTRSHSLWPSRPLPAPRRLPRSRRAQLRRHLRRPRRSRRCSTPNAEDPGEGRHLGEAPDHGEEGAVNADETFNSASVKIPVAAQALEMVDAGTKDPATCITLRAEDVRGGSASSGITTLAFSRCSATLLQMIITSDNTATDLADRTGGRRRGRQRVARREGYADGMSLTQTTGDLFAAQPLAPADDRNARTNGDRAYWLGALTPRATGRMLEAIEKRQLPSKAGAEELVRMLKAQQSGARRLPHFLPPGVSVAHKTGDFPPVLANDVGIIYAKSGPIVVSFFLNAITEPYGEAEDRMGRVTQAIVAYFDK